MRDRNYYGKRHKDTASQMFTANRLTKMMAKLVIQYIYVVCLISSLDLITPSQCSQSANSQTSDKPNNDVQPQSRILTEDIESITTHTNLLSDTEPFVDPKEFQYFNDPSAITTPKYDTINIPLNHQPIHPLDLNESQLPENAAAPYIPSDISYQPTPNLPAPYYPSDTFKPLPPPVPNQYLKVTSEPFWAPEVYKLENQYVSTFRSIRSSVMGLYYRMQDFVSYVMSFFSLENTPLVEGRGKKEKSKGKFKIKKKFKKFLIPLLIAYKLKFFALIPILIGGLVLLVGSTGMAGFFFALFAAVISLKGHH